MKDLFGNELTVEEAKSIEKKGKRRTVPKGNAAPIGSGPKGETCKTCKYAYRTGTGYGKGFWKCKLVRPTRGPGTDIRLKWAACSRWEKGTSL